MSHLDKTDFNTFMTMIWKASKHFSTSVVSDGIKPKYLIRMGNNGVIFHEIFHLKKFSQVFTFGVKSEFKNYQTKWANI